ncbi:MAG: transaldolase [Dehalococcoidia bacterium]
MNPWHEVAAQGQSVWTDYIRREFVRSGELKRLTEEDAVTGGTANPTIFEQAIVNSSDYDERVRELLAEGADANAIYEDLAIDDIRMAADVFRPFWDAKSGADGYISIEVSPKLAHDTAGTNEEARRFFELIDRPNVLIKIPATAAGLPAIRETISRGINVNVTLIFARSRYREVAEAYIAGLEDLVRSKKAPLEAVASVASFFVSRVDTLVDPRLDKLAGEATSDDVRREARELRGKAGIANARLAYQDFLEIFRGERFRALQDMGARVQRPLWASTGVKDPAYRDTMYVEELIGADTVDTVPPATLDAFRDHGVVRGQTIVEDVEGARQVERRLAAIGIDLEEVGRTLEDEGVEKFDKSFVNLLDGIAKKREMVSA